MKSKTRTSRKCSYLRKQNQTFGLIVSQVKMMAEISVEPQQYEANSCKNIFNGGVYAIEL